MGCAGEIKKWINGSKEVKASSAYVICSVLQKCISLITLPLFARLLTTEEYGISTVYASTSAVAILFTTLNIPYGSFSPAMMKFERDREGYISAANTLCVFLTGIYYVVYFVFKDFWNDMVDLPTGLMVLMGLDMLFNTTIQLWMGKARFEYQYKAIVLVTLLSSVLGAVLAVAAVIWLPNKGVVKIFATGTVTCLIGLVIMIRSVIEGRQCFNRTYWKYALTFNIPLIPYYLSQIIFNQSDRLMINRMVGRSDAAMYGVAYTLAFVLTFVLNAINNSFVPWMYQKIKENKLQENKEISIIISAIMAVMLLGLIALAPELILVMAGEQYTSAVWVVPPVAMSLLLLFYSQLFINVEFYYEEKYKLVGASILAAVVNIVLNYFGIKYFGFVAAGYTTLISYILFAVCNYSAMKKTCEENDESSDLYDYKMLIALFVAFAVIGFTFAALYPFRWIRFGIVLGGLIAVVVMRDKVISMAKEVINTIKNKGQTA